MNILTVLIYYQLRHDRHVPIVLQRVRGYLDAWFF
jgi:hypothetical protein